MKLLIDANILLDVLQNREPFVGASSAVWKFCETEKVKGYVSALTVANLVYVMRKELDPDKIEKVLNALSLVFSFTELSPADLNRAAASRWNDFEDAVQSAIAERIGADRIVTRNVRDFAGSKVTASMPSEIIALIKTS